MNMKFKVGDKVRIIREDFPEGYRNGDVIQLTGVSGECDLVGGWDGNNLTTPVRRAEHIHESECELVEPSPIKPDYYFFPQSIFDASGLTIGIDFGNSNKPKQTIMNKISNAIKKFVNADVQTAIKAGFRCSDTLELTEAGKTAAIEALLDATPAAQTAFNASAQEVVAEQEKQK